MQLDTAVKNLTNHGFSVRVFKTQQEAVSAISQELSGRTIGFGGSVTLKNLAECADGKVELVVNGEHQQYADCEQALVNAAGKYVVKSISARADTLVIELTDHSVVQNDLNADWVKDQEKETGEAISFF